MPDRMRGRTGCNERLAGLRDEYNGSEVDEYNGSEAGLPKDLPCADEETFLADED